MGRGCPQGQSEPSTYGLLGLQNGRLQHATTAIPKIADFKTGDYVSGTLVGSTRLASGRFAMIDDKRIGRHIIGIEIR